MAVAFDTLRAARDMEAAGLDRKAAEAVAGAIRDGQGDLATRADLNALRTELESVEARLGTRIGALQWIIGVNLAISLATLAAVLAIAFR